VLVLDLLWRQQREALGSSIYRFRAEVTRFRGKLGSPILVVVLGLFLESAYSVQFHPERFRGCGSNFFDKFALFTILDA
jgi:hypothetical protein